MLPSRVCPSPHTVRFGDDYDRARCPRGCDTSERGLMRAEHPHAQGDQKHDKSERKAYTSYGAGIFMVSYEGQLSVAEQHYP